MTEEQLNTSTSVAVATPLVSASTILTIEDYVRLPVVPPTARLAYGVDPAQFGDLYLPSQGDIHPVLIVIHGGCWNANNGLEPVGLFCEVFARLGIAVWSLEYRRLGNGGGWPNTMLDVGAGADHLRVLATQHPLDLSRVVAVGHSAGGHLALWLAARHRLALDSPLAMPNPLHLTGVVSLAGIPDLVDAYERKICGGAASALMGGSPETLESRYRDASPSALLPLGVPQQLLIGELDKAVPPAHNETYVAYANALGDAVTLTILPSVGHIEVVTPGTAIWPQVEQAILKDY